MYTIHELADMFGLSPRTIHRLVRIGVLPRPVGRTFTARYTAEHVWRLRVRREAKDANTTDADLIEQFAEDDE